MVENDHWLGFGSDRLPDKACAVKSLSRGRCRIIKSRGAEVIGVSVDSHFTHLAWKNTPVDKGGIGNVQFPMVADLTKSIARSYDVLLADEVAFRGSFMIDKKGIVRHQVINDLPLGRNVDPREVGNTAVFLCSSMSSGITGEVIYVDCGYNIMGI